LYYVLKSMYWKEFDNTPVWKDLLLALHTAQLDASTAQLNDKIRKLDADIEATRKANAVLDALNEAAKSM
jgi:hypothetical protein